MASAKRIAVDKYPGVFYRVSKRTNSKDQEFVYYIRYRRGRKLIEEKAGRQFQDDMTPARASRVRAKRIEGELNNTERRELKKAADLAEAAKPTIARLWELYQAGKPERKQWGTDRSIIKLYLQPFMNKTPADITTPEIDALRNGLLKANKAPQTVKHVLALLKRIIAYGVKRGHCSPYDPSRLHFEMPKVDNKKTEMLTLQQAADLFKALDEERDQNLASLMRLALATGMRRGALLGLHWNDVDFERGFITLRNETAKNKKENKIPLNPAARAILENMGRFDGPFVFPGKFSDKPRHNLDKLARRVKKKANLPADFRPLHGLRHSFASWIASSGEANLYELQRLLTHASPQMTQRYAHLTDEALQRASRVASSLYAAAESKNSSYE